MVTYHRVQVEDCKGQSVRTGLTTSLQETRQEIKYTTNKTINFIYHNDRMG